MKEISKEPWNYTFSELGAGQYILSVVCGGVGIYEFIFRLNQQQVESYQREGLPFIARLADLVRSDQAPFESQKI